MRKENLWNIAKNMGFIMCLSAGRSRRGRVPVRHPAAPLVILVRRDPLYSRGFWAV